MFPTAERLWLRLRSMEGERRFNGRPYPHGMSPFPFELVGQGFFPGGDGLWRDETELNLPSPGFLPVGGTVFVENDFGTLSSFLKLRSRGFENPLTWKHLKERIRRADLPQREMFFTNGIVGLRSSDGARALDKRMWQNDALFMDFCREFFVYQMEVLKPRLVIILGSTAKSTLMTFARIKPENENTFRASFGAHRTLWFCTSHPYGDFNFSDSRKAADAIALRAAWDLHVSGQRR
ncbi:MAG: hypothetical protein JWO80_4274 [Bryobacterales bacterium]|nr:hypothetical protein [Bryobacterales bacterium]